MKVQFRKAFATQRATSHHTIAHAQQIFKGTQQTRTHIHIHTHIHTPALKGAAAFATRAAGAKFPGEAGAYSEGEREVKAWPGL